MTRDEWKELWKAADSEREKASVENDAWKLRSKGAAVKRGFEGYISELFEIPLHAVRMRRTILKCECAELLWKKVEEGLTPASAVAALVKVRKSLPKGAALGPALQEELEFEAPTRKIGDRFCRIIGARGARKPRPVKMIARFASEPVSEPTAIDPWESARSSICDLMETEMGGLSDTFKMSALSALKFRLDLVVGDCRRSMKRMKKEMKDCMKPPSRTEVIAACKFLGIQLPVLGASVDLKAAYRARGRAAKPYHHDVNKTEAAKAKFQEIMAAYETLEKHNEGLH